MPLASWIDPDELLAFLHALGWSLLIIWCVVMVLVAIHLVDKWWRFLRSPVERLARRHFGGV